VKTEGQWREMGALGRVTALEEMFWCANLLPGGD